MVYAQTPDLSLPALPPLPDASAPTGGLPPINLPDAPNVDASAAAAPPSDTTPASEASAITPPSDTALPALPPMPGMPGIPTPPIAQNAPGGKNAPPNAVGMAPPPAPDSSESPILQPGQNASVPIEPGSEQEATANGQQAAPDTSLPGLPTPEAATVPQLAAPPMLPIPMGPETAGAPPLPMPEGPGALPLPGMLPIPGAEPDATALPEIRVVRDEPEVKSWQTKLASTVVPRTTKFNYKRQILPGAISATTYSRENQHLPPRMTRDDYAQMLFYTVAHNDVEGTRALLNAGTYINSLNIYGETPLAFARRAGAQDVAALLAARGARY